MRRAQLDKPGLTLLNRPFESSCQIQFGGSSTLQRNATVSKPEVKERLTASLISMYVDFSPVFTGESPTQPDVNSFIKVTS